MVSPLSRVWRISFDQVNPSDLPTTHAKYGNDERINNSEKNTRAIPEKLPELPAPYYPSATENVAAEWITRSLTVFLGNSKDNSSLFVECAFVRRIER